MILIAILIAYGLRAVWRERHRPQPPSDLQLLLNKYLDEISAEVNAELGRQFHRDIHGDYYGPAGGPPVELVGFFSQRHVDPSPAPITMEQLQRTAEQLRFAPEVEIMHPTEYARRRREWEEFHRGEPGL